MILICPYEVSYKNKQINSITHLMNVQTIDIQQNNDSLQRVESLLLTVKPDELLNDERRQLRRQTGFQQRCLESSQIHSPQALGLADEIPEFAEQQFGALELHAVLDTSGHEFELGSAAALADARQLLHVAQQHLAHLVLDDLLAALLRASEAHHSLALVAVELQTELQRLAVTFLRMIFFSFFFVTGKPGLYLIESRLKSNDCFILIIIKIRTKEYLEKH